ncbi:acyltransferase family protein [Actinomyces bovis]|uniref:acyltransferase family protein n=1 Tax=Actinomyces bovis TaxID=1658 RepID=UPI001E314F85|nr:acyltransferase [Actinomyces bovis]
MPSLSIFKPRDLGSRDNALNLLRLVLALLVVFSHTHILAGVGNGVVWEGQHIGSWAVVGFFTISGYLITGARERSSAGKYLINRVARIYPGYLLALVVVAFGFGPAAHWIETGSLDGYLTTPVTPLNYLWGNSLLQISSYSIGTTLSGTPYGQAWNGSLWSLYYEFWCYIIIGVFLSWGYLRARIWPTALLFLASFAAHAGIDWLNPYIQSNSSLGLLLFMLPYFMGGALIYQCREYLPMRLWLSVLCAIGSFLLIHTFPDFGKQLASPLMAYIFLWLGAVLPSPGFTKIHDVSYGVYIFHFPVVQFLILLGLHKHGFWLLLVVASFCTLIMATASWFGIERAAMRWVRGRKPWGDLRRGAAPISQRLALSAPLVRRGAELRV